MIKEWKDNLLNIYLVESKVFHYPATYVHHQTIGPQLCPLQYHPVGLFYDDQSKYIQWEWCQILLGLWVQQVK